MRYIGKFAFWLGEAMGYTLAKFYLGYTSYLNSPDTLKKVTGRYIVWDENDRP